MKEFHMAKKTLIGVMTYNLAMIAVSYLDNFTFLYVMWSSARNVVARLLVVHVFQNKNIKRTTDKEVMPMAV